MIKSRLLLLFLGAFSLGLHLLLSQFAFDDAYIHFRIARNFVEHGRPYFNLNEAVMGTSSSLWTMVLGVVFFIFPSSITAVAVLNALLWVLLLVIWNELLRELLVEEGYRLFAVLCIAGITLLSSVGLMETPLALVCLGMGLRQYVKHSPRAFLWCALAASTRLELVVVPVILLLVEVRRKQIPWRASLLYLFAGALPAVIFSLTFFSELIPHTVAAKRVVYDVSPAEFGNLFLRSIFTEALVSRQKMLVLLICGAIALLAVYAIFRWQNTFFIEASPARLLAGVLSATGVVILAAYMLNDVFIFPWYSPLIFVPLCAAIFLIAAYAKLPALTAAAASDTSA